MEKKKKLVAVIIAGDKTCEYLGYVKNVDEYELARLVHEKNINDSKKQQEIFELKQEIRNLEDEILDLHKEIKVLKGED